MSAAPEATDPFTAAVDPYATVGGLLFRVQERIDVRGPDDCWEWHPIGRPDGYGEVEIDGQKWRSHRYLFFVANGYLPEVVMHICDNPPCVNPLHLAGGTHADNIADKFAKGRNRSGDFSGEKNPSAKLSVPQVIEIKRRLAAGESQSEVARDYLVTRHAIWRLANGRTWKEVAA